MSKIKEKVKRLKSILYMESTDIKEDIDDIKDKYKDFIKSRKDSEYGSFDKVKSDLSESLKNFQKNPNLMYVNIRIEDPVLLKSTYQKYVALFSKIETFLSTSKEAPDASAFNKQLDKLEYEIEKVSDAIDYAFAIKQNKSMYTVIGFLIDFCKDFYDTFDSDKNKNPSNVFYVFRKCKKSVESFKEEYDNFYDNPENKKDYDKSKLMKRDVSYAIGVRTIANKFSQLSEKMYGKYYSLIISHTKNIKNKSKED